MIARRLLLGACLLPALALAKPGAKEKPKDSPLGAWLGGRQIPFSESKNYAGAPDWFVRGSGLVQGERETTVFGVGLAPHLVGAAWQPRVVACHALALLEVKKAFDLAVDELTKRYAVSVADPAATSVKPEDSVNVTWDKRAVTGQWGQPPFQLMGMEKSFTDLRDGKDTTNATVVLKLTLPETVWDGAQIKYYSSDTVAKGEKPKSELQFVTGIPEVTTDQLTLVEDYFAKSGVKILAVHDLPDSLACVVSLPFSGAKSEPTLSDAQKKSVRENAEKAFKEAE